MTNRRIINRIKKMIPSVIYQHITRLLSDSIVKFSICNKEYLIKLRDDLISENEIISEKWLYDLFIKINSNLPISNFIDIGANVGQTLAKIKAVNNELNYHLFEPNPYCIGHLLDFISLNNIPKVEIYPFGVGSSNNFSKLHINGKIDSGGFVIDGFRDNTLINQPIAVLKLEDVIEPDLFNGVTMIKIDVEGSEFDVLKGAEMVLNKIKPIIIIEILPNYNSTNTERLERQRKIEVLLKKLDYNIYRVIKNQSNEFLRLDLVDDFGLHSDLNMCDYVCSGSKLD